MSNMSNIAQRVALKILRKQEIEIRQKIAKIENRCKHNIIHINPFPHVGENGSAACEDCNIEFGWWCPDSPDHVCHYHTHEVEGYLLTARAVELVDDTEYIIHDYQGDLKYENADDCVFCHEPDERK